MKIYRISASKVTCKDCGYSSISEEFKGKGMSVVNKCPKCGYKWIPQTSVFEEVQPTARTMNYAAKVPQASPEVYMISPKGLLEKENADVGEDDVFSFKELVRYNVPIFKTPQQANEFLAKLELDKQRNPEGRKFGRVSEESGKDLFDKLRGQVKDTYKEREEAKMQEHLRRNKEVMKGRF